MEFDWASFILGISATFTIMVLVAEIYGSRKAETPVEKAEKCIAAYKSTDNIEYIVDARIQLEVELLQKRKARQDGRPSRADEKYNSRSL